MFVSNSEIYKWHERTNSETKELNVMEGSYHELSKEPNNTVMFESILRFAIKRESVKCKPFG